MLVALVIVTPLLELCHGLGDSIFRPNSKRKASGGLEESLALHLGEICTGKGIAITWQCAVSLQIHCPYQLLVLYRPAAWHANNDLVLFTC